MNAADDEDAIDPKLQPMLRAARFASERETAAWCAARRCDGVDHGPLKHHVSR
jgi:hypothetical protein